MSLEREGNLIKKDCVVALPSVLLSFFINEFYKVNFQWEPDLIAFVFGAALVT